MKFKEFLIEQEQNKILVEYIETLDEGFVALVKGYFTKNCPFDDERCKEFLHKELSTKVGKVADDFFDGINALSKKFNVNASTVFKQLMLMMGNTSINADVVKKYLD